MELKIMGMEVIVMELEVGVEVVDSRGVEVEALEGRRTIKVVEEKEREEEIEEEIGGEIEVGKEKGVGIGIEIEGIGIEVEVGIEVGEEIRETKEVREILTKEG
jgi:hypothetical protein